MNTIQATIIVTPIVMIVAYFTRLISAYALATSIKTNSRGMAHLKHQQYNKHYPW